MGSGLAIGAGAVGSAVGSAASAVGQALFGDATGNYVGPSGAQARDQLTVSTREERF